jgi:hypothetical protein
MIRGKSKSHTPTPTNLASTSGGAAKSADKRDEPLCQLVSFNRAAHKSSTMQLFDHTTIAPGVGFLRSQIHFPSTQHNDVSIMQLFDHAISRSISARMERCRGATWQSGCDILDQCSGGKTCPVTSPKPTR